MSPGKLSQTIARKHSENAINRLRAALLFKNGPRNVKRARGIIEGEMRKAMVNLTGAVFKDMEARTYLEVD